MFSIMSIDLKFQEIFFETDRVQLQSLLELLLLFDNDFWLFSESFIHFIHDIDLIQYELFIEFFILQIYGCLTLD